MTGKLIDYRFYNQLNIKAIKSHGFQFVTESVLFAVLFLLVSFLFYFGSKKIQLLVLNKNILFIPIILISFILLSFPNGVLNEVYGVYEILNAEEKSFKQALTDLGIPPEKYVTPSQLTAKKGKNIIVICIESLEQGFLGSNFDNITPHLNTLSKEWTYYNQKPYGPGGGWTAASLYNHQVGMPAFFKGQGNAFFQGTTDVKLTGLGHILKKAGYNSKYLTGNKEFAGISDILTAYGIQVISEKNSIGKEYPKVSCGLNDFDLFQEAKLQLKTLTKDKDKPFALFISTVNSHFPNGIYDKRMEKFVPKRKNKLEFSISSIDYLVNDFIKYLKQENIFDNTAIFIFPDHLLMGSTGQVVEKLKKAKRQLYLITNIIEDELHKKTSSIIYQIDLPKMIINGAKINTNAKFLTDFIENDNVIDFLNTNRIKLTTLNTASVTRKDYQNGIDIYVINNKLTVSSDESQIVFLLNKNKKNETFDITFNSEMVSIEQRRRNLKNAFSLRLYDKKYKQLHLIVNIKDGVIDKAYFGNKQMVGIYKKDKEIKYTKKDILLIMESNNTILNIEDITKSQKPEFHHDSSIVSITSSEYTTSEKILSVIKANGKYFYLTRGLNLLTVDNNGKFHLERFDTYGSKDAASSFLIRIESLIKNQKFWAIASHDAINNNHLNFQEKLAQLDFKLLQTLTGRVAYIAYTDSTNKIKEYSSKTSLSYIIPSYIKTLSKDENKSLKKLKLQ